MAAGRKLVQQQVAGRYFVWNREDGMWIAGHVNIRSGVRSAISIHVSKGKATAAARKAQSASWIRQAG